MTWHAFGAEPGLEPLLALEGTVAERRRPHAGTYRCPVCGHHDHAELSPATEDRIIPCSYCGTPLEVAFRGSESLRLRVQVAREAATK